MLPEFALGLDRRPSQLTNRLSPQVAERKQKKERADMMRVTEKPFKPVRAFSSSDASCASCSDALFLLAHVLPITHPLADDAQASRSISYKTGQGADLGVMNSVAQTSVMMHPRNIENTHFPSESGIVRKTH